MWGEVTDENKGTKDTTLSKLGGKKLWNKIESELIQCCQNETKPLQKKVFENNNNPQTLELEVCR